MGGIDPPVWSVRSGHTYSKGASILASAPQSRNGAMMPTESDPWKFHSWRWLGSYLAWSEACHYVLPLGHLPWATKSPVICAGFGDAQERGAGSFKFLLPLWWFPLIHYYFFCLLPLPPTFSSSLLQKTTVAGLAGFWLQDICWACALLQSGMVEMHPSTIQAEDLCPGPW